MKKMIKSFKRQPYAAVFFLSLVLLFTGCGKQMNGTQLMIGGIYFCTLEFVIGGQEFKVCLTRPTAISYRFEVIDPPVLNGMIITCDEQGVTVEIPGLVFNDSLAALPGKSFAAAICSALEAASANGSSSGQCAAGYYEIIASADGIPLSVSLPGIGLKATVSDFKNC